MSFMHDTDLPTQRKYYAMLKQMPQEKRIERGLHLTLLAREARMAAVKKAFPKCIIEEQRRKEYPGWLLTQREFMCSISIVPKNVNIRE